MVNKSFSSIRRIWGRNFCILRIILVGKEIIAKILIHRRPYTRNDFIWKPLHCEFSSGNFRTKNKVDKDLVRMKKKNPNANKALKFKSYFYTYAQLTGGELYVHRNFGMNFAVELWELIRSSACQPYRYINVYELESASKLKFS